MEKMGGLYQLQLKSFLQISQGNLLLIVLHLAHVGDQFFCSMFTLSASQVEVVVADIDGDAYASLPEPGSSVPPSQALERPPINNPTMEIVR